MSNTERLLNPEEQKRRAVVRTQELVAQAMDEYEAMKQASREFPLDTPEQDAQILARWNELIHQGMDEIDALAQAQNEINPLLPLPGLARDIRP